MPFTICYTSSEVNELSEEQLEDLFIKTENHNNKHNITGVLLYSNGLFFQVLEGEKEIITNLYHKIYSDSRHKNIFLVMNKETETAYFKKYKSTFNILKTNEDILQLKKYIQKHSTNRESNKFERLISPFTLFLD